MEDIIKLNVGGKHFVTTRMTLCAEEGSMLSAKFHPESQFSAPAEFEGGIFLDRDPKAFDYVLNYLRNGCRMVYEPPEDLLKLLFAEADYYGLDGLKRASQPLIDQAERKRQEGKTKKVSQLRVNKYQLNRFLEAGWCVQHVIRPTKECEDHGFIVSRSE